LRTSENKWLGVISDLPENTVQLRNDYGFQLFLKRTFWPVLDSALNPQHSELLLTAPMW